MQLILTFAILAVMISLFVSNKVRADLVAICALLTFVLTDILSLSEAFAGFSNSVVIMIAGLFIISAGIIRTGLAQLAGNLLLRVAGNNEPKLFVSLLCIVAFVGAFMSNTGTVALMLPIVIAVAVKIKSNPSKFLIPLSFVSSLSGLLTIIASPPNLIVSQALVDHGYDKLGFFEITPVGIIGVITGIVFLTMFRNVLLPNGKQSRKAANTYKLSPKSLADDYQLGGNLYCLHVPPTSKIIGKQLAQLKIPLTYQLCILKIDRKSPEGLHVLPITFQEMAGPTSVIKENDRLYVQGHFDRLQSFADDYGLLIDETEPEQLVSKQFGIAEVLLTPQSNFINESIETIGFREKYNVNVISINRKGEYVLQNMAKVRLRFGDALLVQGSWDDIELLSRDTNDVVVIGQPEEHAGMVSANGKAPIAGFIMLVMVGMMVFDLLPAVISVLLGAVAMVLTGCLRNLDDAYNKINWESIILIACMLPVATALENTGGMNLISNAMIHFLGDYGSFGVLVGIYLLTVIFGQFISNTATAVLFAPIAMSAALAMDANPYTFLVAIAVASSMAFVTPVASPTNALVMTAGEYKFSDFVKIGIPLQLVMFVVMMITIPLLFPL